MVETKVGPATINERVSGLESTVSSLRAEVGDVKASMTSGFRDLDSSLQSLQSNLAGAGKFSPTTAAAVIVCILALWAAAINPLNNDGIRHDKTEERIVGAIERLSETVLDIKTNQTINTTRLEQLKADLTDIKKDGTPGADRRLAVLEFRMDEKSHAKDKP